MRSQVWLKSLARFFSFLTLPVFFCLLPSTRHDLAGLALGDPGFFKRAVRPTGMSAQRLSLINPPRTFRIAMEGRGRFTKFSL